MKRTVLAFIGLAFAIYWMWTAELPSDSPAGLSPVLPSAIRPTPEPAHKRLDDISNSGLMKATSDLRAWLKRESAKMNHSGNNSASVIRLKRKALSFKSRDLASLTDIALDSANDGTIRYLAVYVIGLAESAASKEALRSIGQTRVPTSPNEKGYSDEIAVRTHALEALVKRLSPPERERYLNEVLTKSNDPALQRRAQYWLSQF